MYTTERSLLSGLQAKECIHTPWSDNSKAFTFYFSPHFISCNINIQIVRVLIAILTSQETFTQVLNYKLFILSYTKLFILKLRILNVMFWKWTPFFARHNLASYKKSRPAYKKNSKYTKNKLIYKAQEDMSLFLKIYATSLTPLWRKVVTFDWNIG